MCIHDVIRSSEGAVASDETKDADWQEKRIQRLFNPMDSTGSTLDDSATRKLCVVVVEQAASARIAEQ